MMRMPYHRNAREISRRTLLRGAGVVMALPWLESVNVFGATATTAPAAQAAAPLATGASAAAAGAFPKRFAAMFWGNGPNSDHWWAKGAGADMELSKTLQQLAPVKEKMNVINGLFNRAAVGVGIHPGQTGNLLSGAQLTKGADLRGGISMDQMLANAIGDQTIQPSMVLGCEQPITGYHETNFSMAYSSHISWQTPTSPVPLEGYPSLAFDSLFENRGNQRNESILDRVRDEADTLSKDISADDRRKLDEYLTSVREVEKRIESQRALAAKAANNAKDKNQPVITMKRPDNGMPEDIREHMRLMCDILAMAFQTDKTRIATLLLCRDLSGLCYPFLGVRVAHHSASHDDHSDNYEKISSFYVSHLAYLTQKLDAMPEGEGTVLDNTCIMFLSNMISGSIHDSKRVPLLTVGGLGGTLQTGRVMDYYDKGDENRRLCSLYLGLMDRMGVKLDKFGDATTRLADL